MANAKTYSQYLVIGAILFCVAFLFPIGRGWQTWDNAAMEITAPFETPYFTGMPFAYFALPHAGLPLDIGNAINLSLNVLVILAIAVRYADKHWRFAFITTMTTPMAMNLLVTNNIDWIPLSSFLVADWLAYPLLAMKPQVLGGAAFIRFKRNPGFLAILPLIIMLIISVLIWGAWWQHVGNGLTNVAWNFAPFPFFIPVGGYILWQAWQKDDEIIAACATPFLVPYFAPYSLVGLHVLLASKHRKIAVWLWCFSWWFVIISAKRMGV